MDMENNDFNTTGLDYNTSREKMAMPEYGRNVLRMEERLRNGWTWGEKRDDAQRTHPDLVPYDELSEASKALDRLAAGSLLATLEEVGLGVYR